MTKVGSRVGAILSGGEEGIKFLGYGVYVGDEVPEGAAGLGEELKEHAIANPKIELDDGSIVWGCECWWGPEEKIRETLEGQTVIEVSIDDARREHQEEDSEDH